MTTPVFLPCAGFADLGTAIAPWLVTDPVPYALICGLAARLAEGTAAGNWGGVLTRAGSPVFAVVQAHPWRAIIDSPLPVDPAVVQAVGGLLGASGRTVRAINGPVPWAEAIAAAHGGRVSGRTDMRLHRLAGAPRLPARPRGVARAVRPDEVPLMQAWLRDFWAEVGQPRPTPTTDEVHAQLKSLLAWTVDDQPVALAARTRPVLGGWSIAQVFTLPAWRGRGYAGAVVHALCEQLLSEGASYLALYTDLSNPVSNHLYARIGFVPVRDQAEITWETSWSERLSGRC